MRSEATDGQSCETTSEFNAVGGRSLVDVNTEPRAGLLEQKRMYDLLVDDQDDFLGIITYSVYKRQKREEVQRFYAKNGKYPTNQDLEQFYELAQSQTQRTHYEQQAVEIINAFVQEVLEEQVEEIEDKYEKKFTKECQEFKPSFWFGMWQSVVGSLVFLLALAILVLISWGFRYGPTGAIERIFNVEIVPQSESTDSAAE